MGQDSFLVSYRQGTEVAELLTTVRRAGYEPRLAEAPDTPGTAAIPGPRLLPDEMPAPVRAGLDEAERAGRLLLIAFEGPG